MADGWRQGFWKNDAGALLLSMQPGTKYRGGFLLTAANELAVSQTLTGALWKQGHLRAPDGALIVTTSPTPPLRWDDGEWIDANGALVITSYPATGQKFSRGALRDNLAQALVAVLAGAQGTARTPPQTPTIGLTYYISPSGNDTTGDGSLALPWQTMQKAHDYLRFTAIWPVAQSIRIYMRGGVYQGAAASLTTCDIAWDQANRKPTASQWVVWEKYPGDPAVVIKPPAGLTGHKYGVRTTSTGGFVADYQQFKNITFDGEAIVKGDGDVVGLFLTNTTHDVEVIDCTVKGMRANYVVNGGAAARKAQGIYIDPNAQNNRFYRTRVFDIGANLGTIDIQEHGIYCSGNNNKFYDCLIYDCPNGYGFQGYNGGTILQGIHIVNCTIAGTFQKSCIVLHGNSQNCKLYNLILKGASEYGVEFYPAPTGTAAGNNIDHVVYHGNTLGNRSHTPAGWTLGAEVTGDPLFVNYAGRSFDLAGGGPAIGYTDPAWAGSTDIDLVARPMGAEDAGAYEGP